nr:exosome complex component ski6 [Quercus suber]
MPLDASTYALAHIRLDGRRWNELRRIHGQISTQASADGSSYLELGNTKVICTISGPQEQKRGGGGGGGGGQSSSASIEVEISIAGFSGTDRKRRARGDKRISELQHTVSSAFETTLFTHLYPHSTIAIHLHVLSQDGGLLAACLNAATLALIDAGIPMRNYIAACTTGSTATYASNDEGADPLLDLNGLEELELPFLTIATSGDQTHSGCCGAGAWEKGAGVQGGVRGLRDELAPLLGRDGVRSPDIVARKHTISRGKMRKQTVNRTSSIEGTIEGCYAEGVGTRKFEKRCREERAERRTATNRTDDAAIYGCTNDRHQEQTCCHDRNAIHQTIDSRT